MLELIKPRTPEVIVPKFVRATGIATISGKSAKFGIWHKFVSDLVRKLVWVSHASHLPREIQLQARFYIFKLRPLMGGSATNAFETSLLELIFLTTPIADLADNDQSSPATTLTFSLHTADPGETGIMTTNESSYTNYARQTVARSGSGFTVTGPTVNPDADITFPASGASGTTITHFGIGTGVSNNLMFSGTVTPNIAIGAAGITPILDTTTAVTFD